MLLLCVHILDFYSKHFLINILKLTLCFQGLVSLVASMCLWQEAIIMLHAQTWQGPWPQHLPGTCAYVANLWAPPCYATVFSTTSCHATSLVVTSVYIKHASISGFWWTEWQHNQRSNMPAKYWAGNWAYCIHLWYALLDESLSVKGLIDGKQAGYSIWVVLWWNGKP